MFFTIILIALSLWFFIYLPTLSSFWYFYTICIIRTERWDHNFHLHQTWKKLKSLRLEVVNHELVLVGGKIVTDYQFKELMKWNEMSHIHWRFAICHKYRRLHSKGKTVNDWIVYWVCLDIYVYSTIWIIYYSMKIYHNNKVTYIFKTMCDVDKWLVKWRITLTRTFMETSIIFHDI